MSWRERLAERAAWREERSLVRRLLPGKPSNAGSIERDGRVYTDLCSNDYLRLSRHPRVVAAAQAAVAEYGAGARASRLVTGDYPLLERLESEFAEFKGTESALVYPSGYQANLGLLSMLLHAGDAVFVDRLAHACIVDGVRLSPAKLRVFPHNDLNKLEALLAKSADAPARWILVDGVYSMDGDIAPLPRLLELAARYDAAIVMDDAHATGVLGESGCGTCEHYGVDPKKHEERLIVTATFSKAIGAQGGVVLGPRALRDALVNDSRPMIYSTGLAPACAGAALESLRVISEQPELVGRLRHRAQSALSIVSTAIPSVAATGTPIVPIVLGESALAIEASALLAKAGLLVAAIRPPTVPNGTARLRATVTLAIDDDEHFERCFVAIGNTCRSLLSRTPAGS